MIGSRMTAAYPLGPLFADQALNIALLSYDGRLHWGLNADWDVLPDLSDLVAAIRVIRRVHPRDRNAAQQIQMRTKGELTVGWLPARFFRTQRQSLFRAGGKFANALNSERGEGSMADRNRRFTLATIALPLLFLAMSGWARAATLTVSNTNDTGIGSLRGEILAASSGDTINFSVSGTITLGSSLPAIAINLTIDGSGQAITVDGADSFEILSVNLDATLNLKSLTLTRGSSVSGGAIFNSGTLTITNSTLSDNQGVSGGAIDNATSGIPFSAPATLTITNSTFSANLSRPSGGVFGSGGAIANDGIMVVTNSTFSDNQASGDSHGGGFGGAISNQLNLFAVPAPTPGTLIVTNSTFSGNQAFAGGGAIGNTDSTASLKSTILAASTGGNCENFGPAIADAGYNISDDNSCGFSGTSINNSTTLHLDPAGLANNGGPTQTIALEPNSEAVDFISVASCTDQSSPTPLPVTTDQRGFPRPDPGNPDFCDAGAFELQTMPFVLAPNSERLQIARGTTPDSDQVNMAFTFIENGFPACDAGDDAFNGITVVLRSGSCGAFDDAELVLGLAPWVVHTVNHESYGTFFGSVPPATVSARMVELLTPAAPACGEWTINIEVAGVDSASMGNGPFALVLSNPDGDTGCFDITNAIVGNQIPTPTRKVRRGVRR